jgi:HAD superfamily hydrolase (TIGR01484 family)
MNMYVESTQWLIVSDFDETFMPVNKKNEIFAGITQLSELIKKIKLTTPVIFGWATGNNFQAIIERMKDYPGFPWDFALTGLGTELYWNYGEYVEEDKTWPLMTVNEFKSRIMKFDNCLQELNLKLELQSEIFQQKRVRGYYLPEKDLSQNVIEDIHSMAQIFQLKSSITLANPCAGDPAGYFDVAIMPEECGKKCGIEYIMMLKSIKAENVLVFGDSCNDLEMLCISNHGYLVDNADPRAKVIHTKTIPGIYCNGIINGIKRHLSNKSQMEFSEKISIDIAFPSSMRYSDFTPR